MVRAVAKSARRPARTDGLAASLLMAAALTLLPTTVWADCDHILPSGAPPDAQPRPVTAEDLVRLRDIGQPDASLFGTPSPLAISPDGKQIAFTINRADPESNSYCRALVVSDIRAGAEPRVIDRGGELITVTDVRRGLIEPGGFPELIVPVWSPGGQWIAYLKRKGGITQVWRVRADGTAAHAVTHSAVDVEAIAWSADSHRIVYASRPGRLAAERRIENEGRTGFHYDDRFIPSSGDRPRIRGPIAREIFTVDPGSGLVAPADERDKRRFPSESMVGVDGTPSAVANDGRRAWTERRDPSPLSPLQLWTADATGEEVRCEAASCIGGLMGLWWEVGGQELRFLRREGWANGQMALYRWTPGEANPRRVFVTGDVLHGCVAAEKLLLCTRENATMPRRLVMIDPLNGRSEVVFDPNPEFDSIEFGKVERLHWRNNLGLEAWGDLVLPPGYRPGKKLPLIVVQYHSDGFLRGGTGDEYPIHAFAARGFAVLSVERPTFFAAAFPELKTYDEINAANAKGWGERRSLLSSIETGVEQVIAMGVADRRKIGLTGLSDGSSTVRFALINSHLFAAAAISTCCMDPKTVMTYGGIAWAEYLQAQGYPPASRDDPDFWRPYSLALNAAAIDTPLLMQLADDEYLLALEAYTALREHGQPVEMYVFPDEHHAKWQPEHRLAVYNRNLDWFDFWLGSRKDHDPAKAEQYRRWDALRPEAR